MRILAFVIAAAGWIGFAAGTAPWQAKDCNTWTDKDIHRILSASPWAHQLPMPQSGRPGITTLEQGATADGPPVASLGNPSNTTAGANMSSSANGSTGPATPTPDPHQERVPTPVLASTETAAPAVAPPITVVWASAAPIRLAVAKMHAGQERVPEEVQARAQAPHDNYVIAVVGLPSAPGTATLRAGSRSAILKTGPEYRRIGNSDVYFYRFAKPPFTPADGKAEFRFSLGSSTLKTAFDLRAMSFDGKPAL